MVYANIQASKFHNWLTLYYHLMVDLMYWQYPLHIGRYLMVQTTHAHAIDTWLRCNEQNRELLTRGQFKYPNCFRIVIISTPILCTSLSPAKHNVLGQTHQLNCRHFEPSPMAPSLLVCKCNYHSGWGNTSNNIACFSWICSQPSIPLSHGLSFNVV